MTIKFARTIFVCAFTALFGFISIMGNGLHLLPGMGHSCEDADHCLISSLISSHHNGCAGSHSPAIIHTDQHPKGIHNSADCAVCMFLSLAKSYLSTEYTACDCLPIVERLAVCSPLLESRFVCSYHTRAPPSDMLQV
jgi:hypothetical protein